MKTYGELLIILILILSCKSTKLLNQDIEMNVLIGVLKKDNEQHEKVEPVISAIEIQKEEKKIGLSLPNSYKLFLNSFGNGAESIYHIDQPINGVNTKYGGIHWLGKYRKDLDKEIHSDGFGIFKTNSLLCLMTENSNGGAWVWLTSENSENGEWPLAFYNMDGKLYYRVENFKEWVRIATKCKGEVIRELEKEYKLNLG